LVPVTHAVCNAGRPRLLPLTAERMIGLAALAYMRGLRFYAFRPSSRATTESRSFLGRRLP
jgi:hypothetical protein